MSVTNHETSIIIYVRSILQVPGARHGALVHHARFGSSTSSCNAQRADRVRHRGRGRSAHCDLRPFVDDRAHPPETLDAAHKNAGKHSETILMKNRLTQNAARSHIWMEMNVLQAARQHGAQLPAQWSVQNTSPQLPALWSVQNTSPQTKQSRGLGLLPCARLRQSRQTSASRPLRRRKTIGN